MSFLSMVVTICTHNNAKLLDFRLSTIERQEVDATLEWSVLVADNNSRDETQGVVQDYIQKGRHISGPQDLREAQQGLCYACRCATRKFYRK